MNPTTQVTSSSENHSITGSTPDGALQQHPPPPQPKVMVNLCASCDRCRTRKTKCDGARPCANCVTRYKKTNKLDRCVDIVSIFLMNFMIYLRGSYVKLL